MTATFEHPDNNDRGDKETKGLMDFVAAITIKIVKRYKKH